MLFVEKTGTGTVLINSTNTYTGGTFVREGTIGGSGTVGGDASIFSTASVAPGDLQSIGTLTVQGDLVTTRTSGSNPWVFHLGANNASDHLVIGGDFVVVGGLNFDFYGSTRIGTFDLITWGDGTNATVDAFSYTNLGGGNTGNFQISGRTLQFVVIPEPTTLGLLSGTLSLLMFYRRRQARLLF